MVNWTGILDTGCTSSAGAEKDVDLFHNTGQPSHKMFMLPDKTKIQGTNTMEFELNLRKEASKMNIVPHLHSTLISVPKMANNGYIAVFKKEKHPSTTPQRPQYQHLQTSSLSHHVAKTQVCGNSTWTTKSTAPSTATNSLWGLTKQMPSLTYPTAASHYYTTMRQWAFQQKKLSSTRSNQRTSPYGPLTRTLIS